MDWSAPFRTSWGAAYDTVVGGILIYLFIIVAVRLLGVRSISHMNNFDWIVVVAIGAITGAAMVAPAVTAVDGITAIATLFALQWAVTWLASRSPLIENLLKESPRVLVRDGKVLEDVMELERITKDEVLAEVRGKGLDRLEDAKAVVLESDSTVSVVPKDSSPSGPETVALQDTKA